MKKLLIAGALALTAILGTPNGAVAAGVEPTAGPIQGEAPLGIAMYADTVFGAKPPPPAGKGCAQSNYFTREQRVVFRMWGNDVAHGGVPLTMKNVESAYVEIPGAPNLELTYGEHGKAPAIPKSFWTAGWTPGASYPLGVVKFRIVVKAKPYKTWVQTKVNTSTKKTKKKTQNVPYIFRGLYTGKSSVKVESGNSWVKKAGFVKKTVKFNLANTKVTAEDTNADGQVNLSDLKEGDKVAVEARLPREDHGKQPFVASRLLEEWMIVVEPGLEGFFTQEYLSDKSRLTITP